MATHKNIMDGWMIISYHPSRWPQGGYPILHPGHVTNQKQAFLFTSEKKLRPSCLDWFCVITFCYNV